MLYVLIQIKARASTSKEVDALVFLSQAPPGRGRTDQNLKDPISGPAKMQVRIFLKFFFCKDVVKVGVL